MGQPFYCVKNSKKSFKNSSVLNYDSSGSLLLSHNCYLQKLDDCYQDKKVGTTAIILKQGFSNSPEKFYILRYTESQPNDDMEKA